MLLSSLSLRLSPTSKVPSFLTLGETYPALSVIPQLVDEIEDILEDLNTDAAADLQSALVQRTEYIWSAEPDVSLPLLAAFFNPNFNALDYKHVMTPLNFRSPVLF